MLKLLSYAKAYLNNKDGATAIEVGLIIAGVSLAVAAVLFTFGEDLSVLFAGMEESAE